MRWRLMAAWACLRGRAVVFGCDIDHRGIGSLDGRSVLAANCVLSGRSDDLPAGATFKADPGNALHRDLIGQYFRGGVS